MVVRGQVKKQGSNAPNAVPTLRLRREQTGFKTWGVNKLGFSSPYSVLYLAVAETSRRMAAKSLKMRVFLDIFEFMFNVT